jgi:hypothetical protein
MSRTPANPEKRGERADEAVRCVSLGDLAKVIVEPNMLTRSLLAAALAITPALAASPQAEGFKKLNGPQIQRAFVGKSFTDGVHFAVRHVPGGTIQGTRMGKKVADRWAVAKDRLCVTDSFGENCYTVWAKGSAVRLAIDGSDFSLDGFLK